MYFDTFRDLENNTPIKNLVVSDFTGLTDKNGKEIYEGDIDKFGYVVSYIENRGCFGVKDSKGRVMSYPLSLSDFPAIGNIYENAELLKP